MVEIWLVQYFRSQELASITRFDVESFQAWSKKQNVKKVRLAFTDADGAAANTDPIAQWAADGNASFEVQLFRRDGVAVTLEGPFSAGSCRWRRGKPVPAFRSG